jgi:hypothetical protein
VSYGLLPKLTSLHGYKGTLAFNTSGFYVGWDVGVDWNKEAPEYALMLYFGGIIGGAFYSGFYHWDQSRNDLKKAERNKEEYGIPFHEYLGIWFDTHDLIKEHGVLLEKAAEKLYQDKVICDQFWEEEILLERR